MYILISQDGRMRAISPDTPFAPDAGERMLDGDLPEGFDMNIPMVNWVREENQWRYDPLPVATPNPTMEDRMTAVEVSQTAQKSAIDDLVQVMADLIGGAL